MKYVTFGAKLSFWVRSDCGRSPFPPDKALTNSLICKFTGTFYYLFYESINVLCCFITVWFALLTSLYIYSTIFVRFHPLYITQPIHVETILVKIQLSRHQRQKIQVIWRQVIWGQVVWRRVIWRWVSRDRWSEDWWSGDRWSGDGYLETGDLRMGI